MDTTTPISGADHQARERLANSLKQMVDEAEHLLKSAQRTGNEQFDLAREKFETQLRHARSELADLQGNAAHTARRTVRQADHAVHEHPYVAMGVTAGVGVLLGLLIARR